MSERATTLAPAHADVAIVGAGAAGLAAGIFAAEAAHDRRLSPPPRIVLLEGAKTLGAKILISGGGRCNVTHVRVTPRDFYASHHAIRHILAAFDARATQHWFAAMGVGLKQEESGKLFPVTDRAKTVLDALLGRCHALGVNILRQHRVTQIQALPSRLPQFVITHQAGILRTQRVILATGGQSLPRTGSDGLGYELARRLGHTVTPTHPALVPLTLEPAMFHASLTGLSLMVEVTVTVDGTVMDRRTGSLLWTHTGVSGPVVMDASRFWTMAQTLGSQVVMACNFCPGEDFARVERWLLDQAGQRSRLSLEKTLAQKVPVRLGVALCQWCHLDSRMPLAQVSRDARRSLTHALTAFRLPVRGHRGWNFAEVTVGGVPLNEIDFRTMASRKTPGLHLVGELLDCDGRIGGFNFQWAWATGYAGGRGAVDGLTESSG